MSAGAVRPEHTRLDTLICVLWLLVVAGAVFVASGWVVPFTRWAQFDNVYFQADIALVYSNMTRLDSNHYRTGMHPLFSIVMWPLVAAIGHLIDAAPSTIVRGLLGLNAGAAATLAFLILRRVTPARLDASLYTLLLCVSASTVFWSTVPETFAFGGTTILLMLAVATLCVRPRTGTLVAANMATLSMTLTNGMVGFYATLRLLWPRWRRSLVVFAAAGGAVLALGLAAKLVIPSSGYAGDFRRYVAWIRAPQASDVRSFFAHSMVMPDPVFRTRGDGALEVVNEISAAGSAGPAGAVGVGLWLALLAAGAGAALSRKVGQPALRDILLLSLGSQFLLHIMFADGPFLYAAHFTPMLVILAAHASVWRWSRLAVVATIAAVAINNLAVFESMTARFEKDLAPWLERHGRPLAPPAGPSSRPAGAIADGVR